MTLAENLIAELCESALTDVYKMRNRLNQAHFKDPYGPDHEAAEDAYFRAVERFFKEMEKRYRAKRVSRNGMMTFRVPNQQFAQELYQDILDAFESAAFDPREIANTGISQPKMDRSGFWIVTVVDVWP